MIVTSGFLSAFQKNIGRIMAYAVMMETGFSLLALGLLSRSGMTLFLALFIPRLFSLITWSLSLTTLQELAPQLELRQVRSAMRSLPFSSISLLLASFSLIGLPILAGFPVRQALAQSLAVSHSSIMPWIFFGSLGLTLAVVRMLAALTEAPEGTSWISRESLSQKVFFIISAVLLCLPGLFPQWIVWILDRLPVMYQHIIP
jgi:multicomponent Na+:H+ antiporter subunit D